MPLTFLLLSLPVSIGAFLIVFAIAFLHELFVVEPHKSERRTVLPNQLHCRRTLVPYAPRTKRALSLYRLRGAKSTTPHHVVGGLNGTIGIRRF